MYARVLPLTTHVLLLPPAVDARAVARHAAARRLPPVLRTALDAVVVCVRRRGQPGFGAGDAEPDLAAFALSEDGAPDGGEEGGGADRPTAAGIARDAARLARAGGDRVLAESVLAGVPERAAGAGAARASLPGAADAFSSPAWEAALALVGAARFRALLTHAGLALFERLEGECALQLTGVGVVEDVRQLNRATAAAAAAAPASSSAASIAASCAAARRTTSSYGMRVKATIAYCVCHASPSTRWSACSRRTRARKRSDPVLAFISS